MTVRFLVDCLKLVLLSTEGCDDYTTVRTVTKSRSILRSKLVADIRFGVLLLRFNSSRMTWNSSGSNVYIPFSTLYDKFI